MTKQLSLHHIIREAKTTNEKAPLLILLHGTAVMKKIYSPSLANFQRSFLLYL